MNISFFSITRADIPAKLSYLLPLSLTTVWIPLYLISMGTRPATSFNFFSFFIDSRPLAASRLWLCAHSANITSSRITMENRLAVPITRQIAGECLPNLWVMTLSNMSACIHRDGRNDQLPPLHTLCRRTPTAQEAMIAWQIANMARPLWLSQNAESPQHVETEHQRQLSWSTSEVWSVLSRRGGGWQGQRSASRWMGRGGLSLKCPSLEWAIIAENPWVHSPPLVAIEGVGTSDTAMWWVVGGRGRSRGYNLSLLWDYDAVKMS